MSDKYNRGIKNYISSFPPLYLEKFPGSGYKKTFTQDHLIAQGSSRWFDNINGKKTDIIRNSSMPAFKKIVPLNAESTPFYIASDKACERIAKSVPNVRIILLLREPVARAYSEYNMKKRLNVFVIVLFLLLKLLRPQASGEPGSLSCCHERTYGSSGSGQRLLLCV